MTITETIARAIGGRNDDHCIDLFRDEAVSVIIALTESGYAIVPVEPTEAMLEMGRFEAESCTSDWTASAACLPGHVWKSMCRASTPDTLKD